MLQENTDLPDSAKLKRDIPPTWSFSPETSKFKWSSLTENAANKTVFHPQKKQRSPEKSFLRSVFLSLHRNISDKSAGIVRCNYCNEVLY